MKIRVATRAIVLELLRTQSGYIPTRYVCAVGKNSSIGSRLRARKQTEIDDPHLAETLARENLRVTPCRAIIIYPANCFSSIYRRADVCVQRTASWNVPPLLRLLSLRSVFRIESFRLVVTINATPGAPTGNKPATNGTRKYVSSNKQVEERKLHHGRETDVEHANVPRFSNRVRPDFPMKP